MKIKKKYVVIGLLVLAAVIFQAFFNQEDRSSDENEVATLYRTSAQGSRMHISTFDSVIRAASDQTAFTYNWENCKIVAELMKNQEGVKRDFWCEKGFVKK